MPKPAAFVSTLFHAQGNPDKVTVALTMAVNGLKESRWVYPVPPTPSVLVPPLNRQQSC